MIVLTQSAPVFSALQAACFAVAFLSRVSLVNGHAYLMDPPSRNLVAANENKEQCPHCVNAGGTTGVKARAKGHHPSREVEGSHGICGDPVQNHPWPATPAQAEYMTPTKAYRTYESGQIITIAIAMSTHHTGHFDFRICDEEGGVNGITGVGSKSQLDAQKCFDKHLLERVDPREYPDETGCPPGKDWTKGDNDCQPVDKSHPERWYQGPRGFGELKSGHPYLSKFEQETGLNGWHSSVEGHLMHYRLPKGLTCKKCTLQWHWQTANSCLPDVAYKKYPFPSKAWCGMCQLGWATMDQAGCGAKGGEKYGEEFWNCADISIAKDDGTGGANGRRRRTAGPAPPPPPPPTCDPNCKDSKPHAECQSAQQGWNMCSAGGDWWSNQCKATCKKCSGGLPACPPGWKPPPPRPSPSKPAPAPST